MVTKIEREAQWRVDHPERVLAYGRKRNRIRKERFHEMYGWVCRCCGEGNTKFLTLEHKDGNPKETHQNLEYVRAVKEFRPDLWETLCFNCNCGQRANSGQCPHTNESVCYGI